MTAFKNNSLQTLQCLYSFVQRVIRIKNRFYIQAFIFFKRVFSIWYMKGHTASCQIVYPNVATLEFTLTRLGLQMK